LQTKIKFESQLNNFFSYYFIFNADLNFSIIFIHVISKLKKQKFDEKKAKIKTHLDRFICSIRKREKKKV